MPPEERCANARETSRMPAKTAPREAGDKAGDAAGDEAPAPEAARATETHEFAWAVTPDELAALDAMTKDGVWEVGGFELKLTNLDKVIFPARAADGDERPSRSATSCATSRRSRRDAAAPPGAAAEPPSLPQRRQRAGLLAEGHPGDRTRRGCGRWTRGRGRGSSGQRASRRRSRRDAVLARQPDVVRGPRLDLAPRRPDDADVRAHRHRSGRRRRRGTRRSRSRGSIRTALEHLGVRGYPKTTGKRGIQVWIPIVPQVLVPRDERLGRGAVAGRRARPCRTSSRGSGRSRPPGRQGAPRLHAERLHQDAGRAVRGRPADGAPVSAPITWDELDDPELRSDRWTIRTVVERGSRAGRPVRGGPDRRAGAAAL